MVTIRNIEMFLDDHPELYEKKYQILGRADKAKDRKGIILGVRLLEIFGNKKELIDLFLHEFAYNPKHAITSNADPRK